MGQRKKGQAVRHKADSGQKFSTLKQIASQPLVGESHRQSKQLLNQHRYNKPDDWTDRSRKTGDTSRLNLYPTQANNSLMTLPEFAIFIGRPFFAVKAVSSEIPSALSTLAMTS